MSSKTAHMPQPLIIPGKSIPVKDILPWAIFGGLICLIGLYFITTEQGALSLFSGTTIHEFVHDGRHLLGFPCH
ncbi:CbtB-domain containing protein [uncultured Bartonella sp.]|uniref:CbtB domain-containing protein n=1 Tax=uncultured Bartonella sp. TaxID=104108 RepID=UPI0025D9BE02|nr:CbtB-domain containing protein [uncultured Bartonella sp.]